MSKHRFCFIATFRGDDSAKTLAEIIGEELHHLKKVLRLNVGEEVEVVDGSGHYGIGLIQELTSNHAIVSLSQVIDRHRSNRSLHLVLGALKKGDLEDIMPSIVEVGIDNVHIFLQEGCAKHLIHESLLERLQKIARSASKQCKRPYFPGMFTYSSLQKVLSSLPGEQEQRALFYCDPAGESGLAKNDANLKDIFVVVGAEAGLSANEEELLQKAGARAINLGPHVLRAKTAAIVSSFYLQQVYGQKNA